MEGVSSGFGTPLSDSASTPRTTFSGTSTAPTSVSSSSVQRLLQEELSTLQEKHALETSALLSALADSQRTTRMLRDEHAQLRERLQYADEQLAAPASPTAKPTATGVAEDQRAEAAEGDRRQPWCGQTGGR